MPSPLQTFHRNKARALAPRRPQRRQKWNYIGAPAAFRLELACQHLWPAFCEQGRFGGLYVVGSSIARPDWRDIDVVCILDDAYFATLFPDATIHATIAYFEHDPRWLVMTVALFEWLTRQVGHPVDFKFQPMTFANGPHHGEKARNAVGLRFAKQKNEE